MATWLPIGESKAEWRRWLQTEKELDNARSEIEALQYELAKYLPPPRTLLECTLRQWCALEKLPFQGKTLAGEELDAFLQESSEGVFAYPPETSTPFRGDMQKPPHTEIVVFFFAQRYFVRGIVTSGLKG